MTTFSTTNVVVAGIDMEVDFDYTPAVRGVYDGPWEDSHPDEPEEIDIIAVRCPLAPIKGVEQWVDLVGDLRDETLDSIMEQISEGYNAERWDEQFNHFA